MVVKSVLWSSLKTAGRAYADHWRLVAGLIWLVVSAIPFVDGAYYAAGAYLGIATVWIVLGMERAERRLGGESE